MKISESAALITACAAALTFASCNNTDSDSKAETKSKSDSSVAATENKQKIDMDRFNEISCDLQAVGTEDVGGWWHLYIGNDSKKPYLSIYDAEAGNPGIEGKIVELDDTTIKIKYDDDLYEELPSSGWKVDGKYLEVTYRLTEYGIELTNNGCPVQFNNGLAPEYLSCWWRAENEYTLDGFEVSEGSVFIRGYIYGSDNTWESENIQYFLSDDCVFTDNIKSHEEITAEQFSELLADDAAENSVIELIHNSDGIVNITLTAPDESRLSE